MENFNVDALDHEANLRLWDIFESYDLIVSGSTHLDGGLVDHVYLLKSFMGGKNVALLIKNIYFTDYDAVKFQVIFDP